MVDSQKEKAGKDSHRQVLGCAPGHPSCQKMVCHVPFKTHIPESLDSQMHYVAAAHVEKDIAKTIELDTES